MGTQKVLISSFLTDGETEVKIFSQGFARCELFHPWS